MRKSLLFSCFLALSFTSLSQLRGGSSLYMLNQSLMNPGYIDVNTRYGGTVNFRKQWMSLGAAPLTISTNGHYRFSKNHGVGLVALDDYTNNINHIDVGANYTYNAWLNKNTSIGMGIKLGFQQRSIVNNYVYFENFDPTVTQLSTAGFNMGFGLSVQSKNFDFGVALPSIFDNQLGKKNLIYDTKDNHLYANIGYKFRMANDGFIFYPTILAKGVPGSNINLSFDGHFLFGQWLWMGGSYKSDNTVGASVGVFLDDGLRIIYSYESSNFTGHERLTSSHEIMINYARSISVNPFHVRKYTIRKGGRFRKKPRIKG
ncbi:MAG: PorP/SprF family type IX secretion system membrane protein [Fluviicola sp.]|nr:PorP/SprF family type IX secretion system membrane protein [Fluviicola sp.]